MSLFSRIMTTEFTHENTFELVKETLKGLITYDAESLDIILRKFNIDFGCLFQYGNFTVCVKNNFIYILNGIDAVGWINQNGYELYKLTNKVIDMHGDDNFIYITCSDGSNIMIYVTDNLDY